jgi:hypothetical protein
MRSVCVATLLCVATPAFGQPESSSPPESAQQPAAPAASPPAAPPDIEEELRRIAEQNRKLQTELDAVKDELELVKEDQKYNEERLEKVSPVVSRVSGYLDFGFFSVTGDGSGIRSDIGFAVFPEYATHGVGDSWLFMGDPLSTMINSRGDPATTGESRAITFDPIRGHSSTFLVNSLNLGLFAEVGANTVLTAKVDFMPRGRDVSDPEREFLGDYVDIRLAYAEHRLEREHIKASLFAGKFDSVIGVEYRSQEAPARIEVTPSLLCRYTCGYPIGLKGRVQLYDQLVLNAAITNGSHFSEGFAFHDEIDTNDFKTGAARLSYSLPSVKELELGVSGMFGAQDNQKADDTWQWLYGVDAHLHRDDLVVRAEFVQGRARGDTEAGQPRCNLAPCLRFKAAYGLVGYRATNVVMPYLRADWRDALHSAGASFVYISELMRVTAGIRLTINEHVIVKGEYTLNRELGRIPQFANDVVTSSLVVKY